MTYEEIVTAAFDDELEQIAGALKTAAPGEFKPNTALTTLAPKMSVAKSPPGAKFAGIGSTGLIGAGVGGALGLAHGLQKDQQGQRHVLRGLGEGAMGAAAGGAVGSVAGRLGGAKPTALGRTMPQAPVSNYAAGVGGAKPAAVPFNPAKPNNVVMMPAQGGLAHAPTQLSSGAQGAGRGVPALPAGQFHPSSTGFTPEEMGKLHPAFHAAIHASPMVRLLGMDPGAVFSAAKMQQKPGEQFHESLNRLSRDVGGSLVGRPTGKNAIQPISGQTKATVAPQRMQQAEA